MKRIITICLGLLAYACASASALDNIVPKPNKAELTKGSIRISGMGLKCDTSLDEASFQAINRFAAQLSLVSGKASAAAPAFGLAQSVANGNAKGMIFLMDPGKGEEEYSISVGDKAVIVKASGLNGFLYALQTIRQMLPESIYQGKPSPNEKWVLPCCEISDSPRFGYRGMHLDCSRHFWSVDEVKKYLNAMAMYKLNRFHWHLTDDQGWRIEIKAYPLLSVIASQREGTMIGHDFDSSDHIHYGGCYSQEEIREVVEYAASLGITVIPEIDLPGHMLAAMSAYPWLGCTGGPYASWVKWGVSDEVLCPGKETTFQFLEAVLGEVADLFPGEYIHIGGDECPKTEWQKCPDCQALIARLGLKSDEKFSAEQYLQNYVTQRVQQFLAGKGKKVIGWDEILEGQLAPGATIMSWRGMEGARQAAAMGYDSILTPTSHFYFDYCQSKDRDEEPLSIGGFVSVEKVYSFDPFDGIPADQQKHILGVQANLWTEYIATEEHLEYMLLPRMLALAEVQWCQPSVRNWERFSETLANHEFKILEKAGFNYRKKL